MELIGPDTNYNVAIIQETNIRVFRQTYDYESNSGLEEIRTLLNPKPIIIGQLIFFYTSFIYSGNAQSEIYCKFRSYDNCLANFQLV